MNFAKKYLTEIVLIIGIIIVFGVTAIFNDAYVDRAWYNITTLILQPAAILGIFALGAAVVIISGGIDLSSGSMIALGASVVCLTMWVMAKWLFPDAEQPTAELQMWHLGIAISATLFVAFLIGTLHAWLITVIHLPPFVATLASLVGLRSMAILMNKSVSSELGSQKIKVNIENANFAAIGDHWWVPVVIFLVLAAILYVILNHTVLGRHLYAMGGNEEAARLCGIRTDRLKWFAYCFAAMTAAIAGILYASRIQSADPESQGVAGELFAIAAAVIGGCSLAGGVGRVSGVVLGALFLRVVIDAVAKMIRAGSDDFEGLIVGLLVVLAVAFNEVTGSQNGWRKQFFPGALGIIAIGTIGLLTGAVLAFSLQLTEDPNSWKVGLGTGIGVAIALAAIRVTSMMFARKKDTAPSSDASAEG